MIEENMRLGPDQWSEPVRDEIAKSPKNCMWTDIVHWTMIDKNMRLGSDQWSEPVRDQIARNSRDY
jgi:hypothetical protein